MIFIPIPLPEQLLQTSSCTLPARTSSTNFQLCSLVATICSTNCFWAFGHLGRGMDVTAHLYLYVKHTIKHIYTHCIMIILYVCIYIYIYIYIHICTYIYAYTYIHLTLDLYISLSLYIYVYIYIYIISIAIT